MPHMTELQPVTCVVLTPTPRIWELFNKPGPLTEDEWGELALYEFTEKEDLNASYQG